MGVLTRRSLEQIELRLGAVTRIDIGPLGNLNARLERVEDGAGAPEGAFR